MSQAYHSLLRQLAEEIGLDPDVLLKTEEIVIDDLPIGLQLEGQGDESEVWLCSLLAAPSPDRWPEVARTVLQANHLWTATGGGTLGMLPSEQREALILVGAGGFAYEEAAVICDCAVGTVKSRVSRARRALQAILESGNYTRDGGGAGEAMFAILAEAERLSTVR